MKNFTSLVCTAHLSFARLFFLAVLVPLGLLLLLEQPVTTAGTISYANSLAKKVSPLQTRERSATDYKRFALQHQLSWCFHLSKKTHKASGELGLYPAKSGFGSANRLCKIDDKFYWDCVTSTPQGDTLHLGLPAPRALVVRVFMPETSTSALWMLTILTFLVASTYLLGHFFFTRPVRRVHNLINSALLANNQDLSALPEKLRSKLAIKEITDLNAAVIRLVEVLSAEEKEETISALTRKKGAVKKAEREIVAPTAGPGVAATSIAAMSKQLTTSHASRPAEVGDGTDSGEVVVGSLLTFPADVLERIQEVLPVDDLRMAFVSIEGGAKMRLVACSGTSETDKLLLESFLSHSEEVISAVMMRDYVQISDKSFARYGLADLKNHLDVAKLMFFELQKTAGSWEGVMIIASDHADATAIDIKQVQRFITRQKKMRALLNDKNDVDRDRWLDPVTRLPNKRYLDEKLVSLFAGRGKPSGNQDTFSVIAIALGFCPDGTAEASSRNQAMALAHMMERTMRPSDPVVEPSAYGRYILHIDDQLFLLVDGWADGKESEKIAGKLAAAMMIDRLSEKSEHLPICYFGVASYPINGGTLEEVIHQSRLGAQYGAQTMRKPNTVYAVKDLPESILIEEASEEMAGNLEVLNSTVLMQSLSSSMRTGELHVWPQRDKRKLRVLWENGKPVQARFGPLSGKEALIEFIVTCQAGQYVFRDRNLAGITHVLKETLSFDRVLLDAALASDLYDAARKDIAPTDKILGVDQSLAKQANAQAKLECSKDEFEMACVMIEAATPALTVEKLREKLPLEPDYMFWRVLHLLGKSGHLALEKSLPIIAN